MSLVSLREILNDKIFRLRAINEQINILSAIEVDVNATMGKNIAIERYDRLSGDDDDYVDPDEITGEQWVGYKVRVESIEFYASISGDRVRLKNFTHEIESIKKFSSVTLEPDLNQTEPSFDGLSSREIQMIEHTYHADINRLNAQLRDIHTNMKYMFQSQVWVNKPQTLLDEKFQGYETIMTKTYLDKILPRGMSTRILDRLKEIESQSKPRLGEPDSLNYFSSHSTNTIKLDLPTLHKANIVQEDTVGYSL